MFNTVALIGRLGQYAEAKTAQNNKECVVLNIASQESWKKDKGEYETHTKSHRVYTWRNLSKFANRSRRGSLSPSKAPYGIEISRTKSRTPRSSTGSPKFMATA